jgi:hypothetical protein
MKLSLAALKERAEATASNELLETITGGNENACHDGGKTVTVNIEIEPAPKGTYTNGTITTFKF